MERWTSTHVGSDDQTQTGIYRKRGQETEPKEHNMQVERRTGGQADRQTGGQAIVSYR
jgi:hypothetical protein